MVAHAIDTSGTIEWSKPDNNCKTNKLKLAYANRCQIDHYHYRVGKIFRSDDEIDGGNKRVFELDFTLC